MEPIRSRMNLGQVILTTFRVFTAHLLPMLAAGTLPFVPAVGVLAWFGFLLAADPALVADLARWMQPGQGLPDLSARLRSLTIPVLPLAALAGGMLLSLLGAVVSGVATTHIVCDACEGRSPTLKAALAAGVGAPAVNAAVTTLLAGVCVTVAALPAGIPALFPLHGVAALVGPVLASVLSAVVTMNLLFAPPVAVAEGKWGIRALRRSVELAWGRCWRNLGVYLAMMALTLLPVAGAAIGLTFLPSGPMPDTLRLMLSLALELGMAPVFFVLTVVLYYDMRAHNGESFGPMPKGRAFPDPPSLQRDGHSFGALPPKSRMRVAGGGGGTRDM